MSDVYVESGSSFNRPHYTRYQSIIQITQGPEVQSPFITPLKIRGEPQTIPIPTLES